MADDLKYGYKGAEPTQSFGNNTGVFDPNDINNLIADNKWTTFGQLELIETQTVSGSPTSLDFTSIKENEYNVMFLTINNLVHSGSTSNIGLRFYESGVLETASVYQYAQQRGTTGGTFSDTDRSTGMSSILISPYSMNAGAGNYNMYCYFYNLGDSSKYSFTSYHSFVEATSTGFGFGSGVLPQTSVVDGIQIYTYVRTLTSGTASLYGIAES
jgi:hypothetical protein